MLNIYGFIMTVYGSAPCNINSLVHYAKDDRGFVNICIEKKVLEKCGENEIGEDLYRLGDNGIKILNKTIEYEQIFQEGGYIK